MSDVKPETIRNAIVEHTRRFAESAVTTGAGTAVPTTPEWTVAELVDHLGRTQVWVAKIIDQRVNDFADLPADDAVVPSEPEKWEAFFGESAQRLANAFSDEALEAQLLNAAGDERSGGWFWLHSSLNEAVVHGFDAENAAGRAPDVAPEIAAELIENHLRMLTSPTWAMQRAESAEAIRGSGQTLQLVAGDAGAWLIERQPDGATWRPGTQQADVTVSGPAGTLLLTLTRRLPLDGVDVDGDVELARHWLDSTAHVSN